MHETQVWKTSEKPGISQIWSTQMFPGEKTTLQRKIQNCSCTFFRILKTMRNILGNVKYKSYYHFTPYNTVVRLFLPSHHITQRRDYFSPQREWNIKRCWLLCLVLCFCKASEFSRSGSHRTSLVSIRKSICSRDKSRRLHKRAFRAKTWREDACGKTQPRDSLFSGSWSLSFSNSNATVNPAFPSASSLLHSFSEQARAIVVRSRGFSRFHSEIYSELVRIRNHSREE